MIYELYIYQSLLCMYPAYVHKQKIIMPHTTPYSYPYTFAYTYRKLERELAEKKKTMAQIIESSNQAYEQRWVWIE
ncbi:hypothetical protein EON63_12890 [archaeon]|nr:MAG: hypothetical protein EON63_12890 [archaeon]